jgi:hypothetical protein
MRAFEEAMKHDATDEEAKRSFYLSKIRWWINTAMDDLVYLHGKDPTASLPFRTFPFRRTSCFATTSDDGA